jgi:CHASE1-domain containing sensor protein
MRLKSLKATVALLCILLSVMTLSNLNSANSESANQLTFNSKFEVLNHQLYVSVTPALYNYYIGASNSLQYHRNEVSH